MVGGRWFVGMNGTGGAINRKAETTQSGGNYPDNTVYNLTTIRIWRVNNQNYCIGFNGKGITTNMWNTQGIGPTRRPNSPLVSAHPNTVLAVFLDGHTQTLAKTTQPAIVKRLATRDDGQQLFDF
jgi:hypothetical protein